MILLRNAPIFLLIMPFAALLQGFSGLGFGIVNMAGFSFLDFDLERISVVVTIVFTLNTFLLLYLSNIRMRIKWKIVLFISIGVLIGIPVGYRFILMFHQMPLFKISLGIIILIASLFFFFPLRFRRKIHPAYGIFFGAVSGFIAGAFMTGGPPLTLYLYSQIDDPRDMKSTVQAAFIIGGFIRLFTVGVGKAGYSTNILLIALIVQLPSFIMLFIGHFLSEKIGLQLIRKIIYGLIGFFGVVIAVNGFAGYIQSL